MLIRMKSLNLYRADADQAVWDRVEQDAKAACTSLSGYLVGVLRRIQQEPRTDQYVADCIAQDMPGLSVEKISDLAALVIGLANERIADISRVEVAGARLAVNTIAYPNGRVGIDATGNLVSVEFDERVIAE
jgi:hypothetical protein